MHQKTGLLLKYFIVFYLLISIFIGFTLTLRSKLLVCFDSDKNVSIEVFSHEHFHNHKLPHFEQSNNIDLCTDCFDICIGFDSKLEAVESFYENLIIKLTKHFIYNHISSFRQYKLYNNSDIKFYSKYIDNSILNIISNIRLLL